MQEQVKTEQEARKTIALRPYQTEVIEILKTKLNQNPKGKYLVQLPTGMGKTVVFAMLIKDLGLKTLVIAHREELIFQAKAKIAQATEYEENEIDVVLQSQPDPTKNIWVASIQTLSRGRRLEKISPDLLIIDEAHHSCADTYKNVLERYDIPAIGFTATPTRRTPKEKAELAKIWGELVYQYPIKKAIIDGYLAYIKYYQVKTQVSLDAIKTVAGDFQADELEEAVNNFERNTACLNKYNELGSGKCVVFCVGVAHAYAMRDLFIENGIETYSVTGNTDSDSRREILAKFQAAPMTANIVLTNVMVLTEGWDCPNVRMIMLARPTQSEIIYLQQLGRGTRKAPEKNAVIIVDIVDNCKNKKLCNCLTTIFNLQKDVSIEGDVIKGIEEREARQKEEAEQAIVDTATSQEAALELELSKILFDMPWELETSKLAWFSPCENEYYCQITDKLHLKIKDEILSYQLFKMQDNTLVKLGATTSFAEILSSSEAIAYEYSEYRYIWDKSIRMNMVNKAVTERQRELLAKFMPHINPDIISRETASKIIGANIAKSKSKLAEPATQKQKNYLRVLGYDGDDLDDISKGEAGKLIGQLSQGRS